MELRFVFYFHFYKRVVPTGLRNPLIRVHLRSSFHQNYLRSGSDTFHHPYLLLRQPIQLVHSLVDLAVERFALALKAGRLGFRLGFAQLFLRRQHPLDKRDNVVVAGFVGSGRDWKHLSDRHN